MAVPGTEGACFGMCFTAWQQVLFWIFVGIAALAMYFSDQLRNLAKSRAKRKSKKVNAVGMSASLLENGQSPGEDLSKPVCADSAKMSSVCNTYAAQNGLEAASLAVLSAFMQRRQYNCPSIGIMKGSKPTVVDIEVAEDGAMSFSSLLEAVDKEISAIRVSQTGVSDDDTSPPEVTLVWGSKLKTTAPGQWTLTFDGKQSIAIAGSSRDEERSFKLMFEACASNPNGDIWQMPLYSDAVVTQSKSWGVALKDFKQYRNASDGRLLPVPKLFATPPVNVAAEAVAGDNFSFNYQELWMAVDAVAQEIKQRMKGKDSKFVVLFMGRGKMLAPSFLGILKAGCTVVPVDVHWPGDRARGVAVDSGAKLVLTDAASSVTWADVGEGVLPEFKVDDQALCPKPADGDMSSWETLDQDDAAVVLFTSGSTGKPKGIVLSHGYLTALAVGVGETKEMTQATRTLSYHSPTWMPFLDYLVAPLLQGGCCLLYPEVTSHVVKPNELNDFAIEKKATLLGLVPAVLDLFIENGLPKSLSTVGVGGAAVTAELCLRVAAAQEKNGTSFLLTTGYSGTEQGDVTNIRMRCVEDVEIAACDKPVMGAGRPHAGQNHVIVDRRMSLVGPGAIGEVMVSGPGLATGYLGLPQQTSEYFINCGALGGVRAARTGDLGRWTQEGSLEIVGRLGSMVKVRGARVDLGEVEVVIGSHAAVKTCVVTVHDDKLVAYVEPAVPGDLRDHCKSRLVAYMVPHVFEGLEELPRLANGKINKKALKPPAPRENGEETVMEMDSLGQMRKFSRKDAAEDVVLDNVRAILIGVVILSHATPMTEGSLEMIHGKAAPLHTHWTSWQYWFLYLVRSGGWSSLAFLSGFDDTRAEHKGYGLTYREVMFLCLWVFGGFNWTMWYLPAFVYMRLAFVAWAKLGLERTHMVVASQLFITLPAFVDLYVGWNPPYPGQDTVCKCSFCPFEEFPWAQSLSYYFYGYWNSGVINSYLGHGLIFVPCYWIGLYGGKYIFPFLCKLSNEKNWLRRVLVAACVIGIYLAMFSQEDAMKEGYDDRCSSFWNDGGFVWLQVMKNVRYFALNLSMSLLYVIVIAAMVPVHLKFLSKISFSSLLFSPFSTCVLDLPVQALALRSVLHPAISPSIELVWVVAVPFLYELACGAMFSVILPVVFKAVMLVWMRFTK